MPIPEGHAVVYELIRTKGGPSASDVFSIESELGAVDNALFQRYARPYTYFHEDTIYSTDLWRRIREDGTIEQGFRVLSAPNPAPFVPAETGGPPEVRDELLAELSALAPNEEVRLMVKVRNIPEWNIPLLPPPGLLSASDHSAALAAREEAKQDRIALLDDYSASVATYVLDAGGRVVTKFWQIGWLLVALPAEHALALLERDDLARITKSSAEHTLALSAVDFRPNDYVGIQGLWDDGYDGGTSANPFDAPRLIAVVEPWALEDEACAFKHGANCAGASRIAGRFRCDDQDSDGDYCEWVSGYSELEEGIGVVNFPSIPTTHGTLIASVALADYSEGQGSGLKLADFAWSSGAHSAPWEANSTASAPEAELLYLGIRHATDSVASHVDGVLDAASADADVITNGWSINGYPCDITNNNAIEEAYETAFDDGVLNMLAAGNNSQASCASLGSSSVASAAQIPKTLAINGLDVNSTLCNRNYQSCKLDLQMAAQGGLDVTVNGVTQSGEASTIDLVVPQRLTHLTDGFDDDDVHYSPSIPPAAEGEGVVRSTGFWRATYPTAFIEAQVGGTSVAAPKGAGVSATLLQWLLDDYGSTVQTPGWMHAFMLLQGDAHFSSAPGNQSTATTQASAGADRFYGMGRLKVRYPGAGGPLAVYADSHHSVTFTSTGSQTVLITGGVLPAGTGMVKCVAYQVEDMSSKSEISDVNLTVWAKNPFCNPTCTCNYAYPTLFTRSDGSEDYKKMVAIRESLDSVTLDGKCAHATLDAVHVEGVGINVKLACYVADLDDDLPN